MKKANSYYIAAWIVLALSLLSVYMSVSANTISRYVFYNSDALYIPSIYQDIASGQSLSGWSLQPAPSFFPDMPLYFFLNAVTGNFHVAIMLYGLCQSLLFIGSLFYLSHTVWGMRKSVQTFILLVGTALFFLLASRQLPECLSILQSGHHFGATIMFVISLALIVDILKRETLEQRTFSRYFIVGGLATMTLISDMIYLVQFLIPVLMSLGVLFALHRVSRKTLLRLSGSLMLPVVIMHAVNELLLQYWKPSLPPIQANTVRKLTEIIIETLSKVAKWSLFSRDFSSIFIVLWFAFVLGSIVLSLRIGIRLLKAGPGSTFGETGVFLVISCFLFSLFTNIAAAAATMNSHPRYFAPTLMLPLFFGWPFLIAGWQQVGRFFERKYAMWLPVGAMCCFSLVSFGGNVKNLGTLARLSDYYPPFVRCLDKHAQNKQLRYGVSSYWRAKYITMLSKNNVQVVQAFQIADRLSIDHWINNLNWYNNDLEFIVIDKRSRGRMRQISQTSLLQTFGPPAERFACKRASHVTRIFVYNRDTDTDFRESLRYRKKFDFYALELPSNTGRQVGLSRVAEESTDKRGNLTFGPYLALPIGKYAFEIHYYAQKNSHGENVGKWDIVMHTAGETDRLKQGKIEKDGTNSISGTFTVRKTEPIEIRIYYSGRGTLRVDKIKVRKII